MKWPEAAPVAGGEAALLSAVADVAERSFYAMVEPCEMDRFNDLAASHRHWLSAVVGFEGHDCAGAVSCRLPAILADRLFDAFTGRDPDDRAAPIAEIHDLVGEFANMICGSWLTRAANERTFTLRHPMVAEASLPSSNAGIGVLILIDDQPCLVDVAFSAVLETAAAR